MTTPRDVDTSTGTVAERVVALPWPRLHETLDNVGFAHTPTVLRDRRRTTWTKEKAAADAPERHPDSTPNGSRRR